MIYNTVEIKKRYKGHPQFSDNVWEFTSYCDGVDRQREKTCPNPMGFFHYPAFLGFKYGKTKLIERMIKDRNNLIKQTQKEIKDLQKFV